MIKNLKPIPLGMVCLMVMCVLCLSLNAQSSSKQNSNSDNTTKLIQLIQQETELTKAPLTDENVQKLEVIQEKRIALQKKIKSKFQSTNLTKSQTFSTEAKALGNNQQKEMVASELKAQRKKPQMRRIRKKAKPLIVN